MGLKYGRRIDRESAAERLATRAEAGRDESPRRGRRSDTMMVAFGKSLTRQLGTQAGRAFFRGVLGTLTRHR